MKVAPSQIEQQLTSIWESLKTSNKMRACLFNLIIYAPKNERSLYLHNVAEKVIEKFPSRILLILADKQAADTLETNVSVLTRDEFACDFIELSIGGKLIDQIPFLVLPHIVPDLPTYVVWAEDLLDDSPLTHALEQITTRLIFDSETSSDIRRFAQTMLKRCQGCHCEIADLNWARLESFRDVISSSFYSHGRTELLNAISSIEITYNNTPPPFFCNTQVQPLFLQGWLAAQLGWKLKEKKESVITYQNGVSVKLFPESNSTLSAGTILGVEIFTTNGIHFSMRRSSQFPHQITATYSTKDFCELPSHFVFAKAESGQSLVKEICHRGTSSHYLKMLEVIAQ
jgi:glucose-6-phosphate dehydrogenase assembly protein OpcA